MKKQSLKASFKLGWTNVLIHANLPHPIANIVCDSVLSLTQVIEDLNKLLESDFKITHNILLNIRNELYNSRPGPYTIGIKDNKFFIKPNTTPEAMIWLLTNDAV